MLGFLRNRSFLIAAGLCHLILLSLACVLLLLATSDSPYDLEWFLSRTTSIFYFLCLANIIRKRKFLLQADQSLCDQPDRLPIHGFDGVVRNVPVATLGTGIFMSFLCCIAMEGSAQTSQNVLWTIFLVLLIFNIFLIVVAAIRCCFLKPRADSELGQLDQSDLSLMSEGGSSFDGISNASTTHSSNASFRV